MLAADSLAQQVRWSRIRGALHPVETEQDHITSTRSDAIAEIPSQKVKTDSIVDLETRSVCLRQPYDFVFFNETRDELAAVKYDQNEVHIYSTESLRNEEAEPVVYAVPEQSRFLVFKPLGTDGVYCAAGQGHSIAVFSADGKGAMRSIQLKPGTIYGLAASESPADPWVFVARGQSHDVEVSAFHITTGEVVENVGKLGSGTIRVSPSGQQVTDGWRVMTRIDLLQPPTNLPTQLFYSVDRIPGGQSTLFFAHNDQFLVRNVVSTVNHTTFLDLASHAPCKLEGENRTPLSASPSCAFRKIPLMVGKWTPDRRNVPAVDHPGQVLLDTFLTNTFERIPTYYRINFDTKRFADFAPTWTDKVYGNGPRPPRTESRAMSHAGTLQLLPDNRNEQLLCVLGRQVLIVPAAEFQHGTDDAVKLPTVSIGPHPPGLAVRIPLATDPAVKVSLGLPLPEGSSIDGETFVWTPTDEQLGTHQLRFIYESGGSKRTLHAPLTVGHRWTSLKSVYQRFHYGNGTGGLYGWSIDGLSLVRYQPDRKDFASSAPMTGQYRTSAIILDFIEKTFDDRSYLCVLTKQPSGVQILDAALLELIREIPIVSSSPLALIASQNPEDPFLYYTVSTVRGKRTGVIRLNPIEDAGLVDGLKELSAVTHDGRIAFDSQPSTFLLVSGFGGELPEFAPWRRGGSSFQIHRNTIMDRGSDLVVSNNIVRSALRHEKGLPIAEHVIYVQDDSVVTVKSELDALSIKRQSYMNPELPVHTLRLTRPLGEFKTANSRQKIQTLFFAVDSDRKEIIVCHNDQLMVQPLKSLGFEDEPAMDAELIPDEPLLANTESKLVLKGTGPHDEIRIDKLPESMTADGMNLTWKPDRSDIGVAQLQVTVRRGERRVNRTVCVHVCGSRREIELVRRDPRKSAIVSLNEPLVAGSDPDQIPAAPEAANSSGYESPDTIPSATPGDRKKIGPPGKIQIAISNDDADTTLIVCENAPQLRLFRNEEIETGEIIQGTSELSMQRTCRFLVSRQLRSRPVYVAVAEGEGFPPELVLLDASTLQEIQKIPLPNRGITDLSTSAAGDDPHVFCSIGRSETDFRLGTALLAINLESDETHEILKDVEECEVSADGRLFYVRGHGRSRDKCIALRTTGFDAAIPECQELANPELDADSGQFMASPFGAVMLLGTELYDDQLRDSLSELPKHLISPVFLKSRAAIVGLMPKPKADLRSTVPASIVVGSFDANTMKLSDVDLVVNKYRDGDSLQRLHEIGRDWKLIPDEKRGRIICVADSEFITFDLDELQIPRTGHLGAKFLGSMIFKAGEQGEIEIELPPNQPQLRITDSKLLTGMVLKDNKILWTPEILNIGQSEISVTISNELQSRICRLIVNVARPESAPVGDYNLAALSTVDGSLILTSEDKKQLLQFPVAPALVGSIAEKSMDLNASANALLTKQFGDQHFLIVGIYANREIQVVDAVTWQPKGSIPVSDWDGMDLQVSQNPDDPFVYYTNGKSIAAASLKSMQSKGMVIADASGGFAIDPSGSLAYATWQDPPGSSPRTSGGLLAKGFSSDLPEFAFVFKPEWIQRRREVKDTRMCILPDWYGTAAFVDQGILDAGMSHKIHIPTNTHASVPVGFVRRGGAAITIQYDRPSTPVASESGKVGSILLVASSVHGEVKKYGEVTLASDKVIPDGFGAAPVGWKALIDDQHGRIICLGDGSSQVINMDELGIPKEQPLLALLTGPHQVAVGRSSGWTMVGAPPDAQITFQNLPEGAVAKGNHVTWTPTAHQAGRQFLEVELQRGVERTRLKHEIDVSWPLTNLPFSPVGVSAEYIGSRVAMWQRAAINPDLVANNDCGQLLVVNTANGKTLYSGQLMEKNPVGKIEDGVTAGDRFVFYNRTRNESEIWSIPLDGSTKAKPVNIPGDRRGEVFSLSVLSSSVIVEFLDRVVFLDAQTLEPTRQIKPAEGMVPRPVISQGRFGPSMYGVVLDETMKPVIAERSPWYSPDLFATGAAATQQSVAQAQPEENSNSTRPKLSRGQVGISLILNTDVRSNTKAAAVEQFAGIPLPARKTSQHWTQQITADIRYSDADGTLLTKPLGTMNFRFTDEFIGFMYLSRVSDVVLCAGRKLLILPLPNEKDFVGSDVRRSVTVVPTTPHLILSSTAPTTLNHEVYGDKDAVVATSGCPAIEGITFDPTTLDVTMSGPGLRRELTKLRAKASIKGSSESVETPETRAEVMVANLRSQQQVQAMEVLQYTGTDILEPVPVVITMKDKLGNVADTLSYFVFIELNPNELKGMIAAGLKDTASTNGAETSAGTENSQELLNSAQDKLKQLLDAGTDAKTEK